MHLGIKLTFIIKGEIVIEFPNPDYKTLEDEKYFKLLH
jgi:hypothetical protein